MMSLGQPKIDLNTNILDIEVPKQLETNISTGNKYFDALFARDGVTPSTSAFVTGIPGSGKSTILLQLADSVNGEGHIAIYNGLEENLFQVRKTVRRLGLKNGFIPMYENNVVDLLKKVRAVQKKNPKKQVFLFVDSLQCIELGETEPETSKKPKKRGRPRRVDPAVECTRALTEWAKETFGIVFIIGMVNKSGEFAGKQTIKHIIDVHLHLAMDTDRKSESYGQRVACMEKNRFGLASTMYTYDIGEQGITFEMTL